MILFPRNQVLLGFSVYLAENCSDYFVSAEPSLTWVCGLFRPALLEFLVFMEPSLTWVSGLFRRALLGFLVSAEPSLT